MKLDKNFANGYDLLVECDSGNLVRIATGNQSKAIFKWLVELASAFKCETVEASKALNIIPGPQGFDMVANSAGGYDLVDQRDPHAGVRILTGKHSKKFFKHLEIIAREAVETIENEAARRVAEC